MEYDPEKTYYAISLRPPEILEGQVLGIDRSSGRLIFRVVIPRVTEILPYPSDVYEKREAAQEALQRELHEAATYNDTHETALQKTYPQRK